MSKVQISTGSVAGRFELIKGLTLGLMLLILISEAETVRENLAQCRASPRNSEAAAQGLGGVGWRVEDTTGIWWKCV